MRLVSWRCACLTLAPLLATCATARVDVERRSSVAPQSLASAFSAADAHMTAGDYVNAAAENLALVSAGPEYAFARQGAQCNAGVCLENAERFVDAGMAYERESSVSTPPPRLLMVRSFLESQ